MDTNPENVSKQISLKPAEQVLMTLSEGWQFRQFDTEPWFSAEIPGNNIADLLANGLIDEPYFRANENTLQWIEKVNWEYQTTFKLTDESQAFTGAELIFDGLDTYAEVYLNDQLILNTNNMFVQYRKQVRNLLKTGENKLYILFKSPINEVAQKASEKGFLYPAGNDHSEENLSVYSRKAPYHFGWDWGPRFVSSGIWRPVALKLYNHAQIQHIHFDYQLAGDLATGNAHIEIEALESGTAVVELQCLTDAVEPFIYSVALSEGVNTTSLAFSIPDCKKWWPRSYGEPYLYEFQVRLMFDCGQVDYKNIKVGFREIELVNEPDEHGESFYFKVNGIPVFAKGANYIPQDSLLNKVTPARYQQVFTDVIAANMNMVRVWGGGIYENDIFYDLADELGILIWQDFMFACTMYPGDDDFLDTIRQEVNYNVKRLRSHPSIAIWCGNNEIEVGWKHWGWQEEFAYSKEQQELMYEEYQRLFKGLLPTALANLDPGRFYLSSSPISHYDKLEKFGVGNNHYWGVWHGQAPFEDFKTYVPRFMSEYGFQSFPLLDSVNKYTLPEDWCLESEVMKLHQKHPNGNRLINTYLLRDYQEPKDFESFLYVSQVLQAEGIKMGIEAHRRNKPFCMGTLYWQLNDCWPVASWSGIDYYGKWKALHYMVGKAYQDILVSCNVVNNQLEVFIVSDLLKVFEGRLVMQLCKLNGTCVTYHEQDVKVADNASKKYFTGYLQEVLADNDPTTIYLRTALYDRLGNEVSNNICYLVPVKDLQLGKPNIKYTVNARDCSYEVSLTSDILAKNVYLEFEAAEGNFSDNFFDLLPETKKVVTFPAKGVAHDEMPKLKIVSLIDTYSA